MTIYEKWIVKDTGCPPEDAAEIEEYMRFTVFHSSLSHLSREQLRQGAITAYSDILFIRSEEGKQYTENI
jgi:hypothetical protein